MGLCEVLTLVFVVLKLCGVIDWTWGHVLLPELIGIAGYIALAVAKVILATKVR